MAGKTWRMPPIPPKYVPEPPKIDIVSGSEGAEVFFTVSGLDALEANLMKMPQVIRDAAGFEMADIAHEVIVDAQEHYVPVDTGNLRDSGDSDEYVSGQRYTITQIAMWFGGLVGPEALAAGVKDVRHYALEQHENMEFNHPRGGGPKYLERPFMKAIPTVGPRIAKAIFARAMAEGGAVPSRSTSPDTVLGNIESALLGAPDYPGYGPGHE